MRIMFRALGTITLAIMMGAAAIAAEPSAPGSTASPEGGSSAAPVQCGKANAVTPIRVAAKTSPCPGGVYCNNPNTTCGEFCCEWGYFYSNPCTCRCYKSSDDAGAKCSSYFRCN